MIFSGIGFSLQILWLPLIILAEYILSLALIFITCAIDVYIRDAEYIINFIIQMLFYATPILYNASLFSGSGIAWIIKLNPMAVIIDCYRDILFYQSMPHIKSLLIVIAGSILLLIFGYKIFKKLEKGFAEEV